MEVSLTLACFAVAHFWELFTVIVKKEIMDGVAVVFTFAKQFLQKAHSMFSVTL